MTAANVHHFKSRKPRPCPMCKKPSTGEFHPFCTKRCADIDLGKWLGGNYAVPVVEPSDDFGAEVEWLSNNDHPEAN